MFYKVSIQYITPSNKASIYTETMRCNSMQLAIESVKKWLLIEPKRRVKRIEHITVETV